MTTATATTKIMIIAVTTNEITITIMIIAMTMNTTINMEKRIRANIKTVVEFHQPYPINLSTYKN